MLIIYQTLEALEGNRMSGGYNGVGEMRMNMLLVIIIFLSKPFDQ